MIRVDQLDIALEAMLTISALRPSRWQDKAAEAETTAADTAPPASLAATSPDKPVNTPRLIRSLRSPISRSVQTELRRVGCLTGAADGEWNSASQRSMAPFNKNAGTKFDVKLASFDALDAIKLKPSRVCPLVCEHGFKAEDDRCSKIVFAEGSFPNDDNECEKRRAKTPTARHESDERPDGIRERPRPEAPGTRADRLRPRWMPSR